MDVRSRHHRRLRDALPPDVRYLMGAVGGMLTVGAVFYTYVEGWRPLDALYFCVVSLATVGYGDLAPVTDAGRAFTIVYLLVGIGLVVSLGARVASSIIVQREARQARAGDRRPPASGRDGGGTLADDSSAGEPRGQEPGPVEHEVDADEEPDRPQP
jgi:voltage-gated potassium channel